MKLEISFSPRQHTFLFMFGISISYFTITKLFICDNCHPLSLIYCKLSSVMTLIVIPSTISNHSSFQFHILIYLRKFILHFPMTIISVLYLCEQYEKCLQWHPTIRELCDTKLITFKIILK